jgi:hypothetical protein
MTDCSSGVSGSLDTKAVLEEDEDEDEDGESS